MGQRSRDASSSEGPAAGPTSLNDAGMNHVHGAAALTRPLAAAGCYQLETNSSPPPRLPLSFIYLFLNNAGI